MLISMVLPHPPPTHPPHPHPTAPVLRRPLALGRPAATLARGTESSVYTNHNITTTSPSPSNNLRTHPAHYRRSCRPQRARPSGNAPTGPTTLFMSTTTMVDINLSGNKTHRPAPGIRLQSKGERTHLVKHAGRRLTLATPSCPVTFQRLVCLPKPDPHLQTTCRSSTCATTS